MQTKGLVIQTKDDKSEILVYRAEACGSCEACGACGVKPQKMWIDNTLNAEEGDFVVLEMNNKKFFSSVAKLYLLPLVLFVLGILISYYIMEKMGNVNEIYAFLGGLAGLGIFFIIARILDAKVEKEPLVSMVRIVPLTDALTVGSCPVNK